jgi:type IV secretory pathway TraG/TraD family ATPase VirD4
MKKLLVFLLIVTALLVVYNIRTRAGQPGVDYAGAAPFLAGNAALEEVAGRFLTPGAYALWYLGLDIDTPPQLAACFLISWYVWLFLARTIFFAVGRCLGLAPISSFHYWTYLWLPWRPLARQYIRLRIWIKQRSFGSKATASWASFLGAMTKLYRGGDQVPLGRLWGKGIGFLQPVGVSGPGHVAVAAKTGAGKTTWGAWWIRDIPRNGSALIIDGDGELADTVGAGLKDSGHPLFVLDPYRLSGHPSACWNPFDELDRFAARHGRQGVVRFAQTLADALCPEFNRQQPIFTQGARRFLCGVILFVWLFEPPERHTLMRVRELIARGYEEAITDPAKQSAMEALYMLMKSLSRKIDDKCGGEITNVIAAAAEVLKSGRSREGGNPFLSTLLAATAWIEIPELARTLTRSDFSLEDLKVGKQGCVVVIVIPVIDMRGPLNGYVRALSMLTFYIFENIIKRLSVPCLFFMDEAASLKIEYLDVAAPVARRHGIRLVVIFQDIPLLRSAYPETWASFISNALVYIVMATDDVETLEHAAKLAGRKTDLVRVEGSHWIWRLFGLSNDKPRYLRVENDLITLDQLREFLNRARGQIVAFIAGEPPLRLALEGYLTALAVWQYAASKHYREKLLRAVTRYTLAKIWLRVRPARNRVRN